MLQSMAWTLSVVRSETGGDVLGHWNVAKCVVSRWVIGVCRQCGISRLLHVEVALANP